MFEFLNPIAYFLGYLWILLIYIRIMRFIANVCTMAWFMRGLHEEGAGLLKKFYNILILVFTMDSFTIINKEDESDKRSWKKF